MLYSAYQALTDCLTPWQQAATLTTESLRAAGWTGAAGIVSVKCEQISIAEKNLL